MAQQKAGLKRTFTFLLSPVRGKEIEMANIYESRLSFAQNQLRAFGKLLDTETLASLEADLKTATEDCAYGEVGGVNGVVKDVVEAVLVARIGQIRSLVERKAKSWNERFSEPFAGTETAKAAEGWLDGAGKGDPETIQKWIDAGWDILKGSLNAPWGRCSCGRPLFPRQIKTADGKQLWRTFKDCPTCHWAKVDAQSTLQDATRGVTPAERKQRSRHAEARAERKNGPIGGRGKGKKSSKK